MDVVVEPLRMRFAEGVGRSRIVCGRMRIGMRTRTQYGDGDIARIVKISAQIDNNWHNVMQSWTETLNIGGINAMF